MGSTIRWMTGRALELHWAADCLMHLSRGAVVQKEFHDLVISTYGRGLYIFDDIHSSRAARREVIPDAAAVLFEPRKTYRFYPWRGSVY